MSHELIQTLVQVCSRELAPSMRAQPNAALGACYTLLVNTLACIRDDATRRTMAEHMAASLQRDVAETRHAAVDLMARTVEVAGHA